MSLSNAEYSLICHQLLQHIECGVLIAEFSQQDGLGPFVEANDFICQRLGYPHEVFVGNNISLFSQQYGISNLSSFATDLFNGEGELNFRDSQLASDSSRHEVKVSARLLELDDASYVLFLCHYLHQHHSDELQQDYIKHMLEHAWDEIYLFDSISCYISEVNKTARENLGYSDQELKQIRFTDILSDLSTTAFQALTQPLTDGQQKNMVVDAEFVRKDMSSYPVEIRLQLADSGMPPMFIANVQDISERKRAEQQLIFLSNYDSLTGLPNRTMFLDRLTMAIEAAKRIDKLVAILIMDLDDFKMINDNQGHDVGDRIITQLGKRLVNCVRSSDTVARLGGDEFGLVLTNISNLHNVILLVNKITGSCNEPIEIDDQNYQLSCSIGISHYPMDDNDDVYSLIKMADTAMYQAKEKGKNGYQFYDAGFKMNQNEQKQLSAALGQAMEKQEFSVVYQPRLNLLNNELIGAEALVRWTNPQYLNYLPADFIPILEANGNMCELDLWVIDQVCRQLKHWIQVNPSLKVSVNLSAAHFNDQTLVSRLREILIRNSVSPLNLELEITEAAFISARSNIGETLNALKRMEIGIILDDFGGGFSSLGYLKQFSIDVLKIDRSLIFELIDNPGNSSSVEAIIHLARNLNMGVSAKGIETEAQAQLLRQLYCEEGQGYLFGRPMSADEFSSLL